MPAELRSLDPVRTRVSHAEDLVAMNQVYVVQNESKSRQPLLGTSETLCISWDLRCGGVHHPQDPTGWEG